ncbi:MAG: hypothetical protein V1881_02300 [Candidatus Micrarchaeota archaeon]
MAAARLPAVRRVGGGRIVVFDRKHLPGEHLVPENWIDQTPAGNVLLSDPRVSFVTVRLKGRSVELVAKNVLPLPNIYSSNAFIEARILNELRSKGFLVEKPIGVYLSPGRRILFTEKIVGASLSELLVKMSERQQNAAFLKMEYLRKSLRRVGLDPVDLKPPHIIVDRRGRWHIIDVEFFVSNSPFVKKKEKQWRFSAGGA